MCLSGALGDVTSTSVSSLAQSCKKFWDVVRQCRLRVGFLLKDEASAETSGRCLARLQACSELVLCFAKDADPSLCLGVFMQQVDGPVAVRLQFLWIEGAVLDAATVMLLGKVFSNIKNLYASKCLMPNDDEASGSSIQPTFKPPGEGFALACVVRNWPDLQRLNCVTVTSRSLQRAIDLVAQLVNLQLLKLISTSPSAGAQAITPVVLTPLSALTGLSALSVDLHTNPLPQPADWGWLRNLRQLRSLRALGSEVVLDGGMGVALSSLPFLDELKVDAADEGALLDESTDWCLPEVRSLEISEGSALLSGAAALALAERRCPRAARCHTYSLVQLDTPASDSPQQLAAKLRALQALSDRDWLGHSCILKVEAFGGGLDTLNSAMRQLAEAHGVGSDGTLLPRLGKLHLSASISPPHVAWLVARMPNLRSVACGYQALPVLSGLTCLTHISVLAQDGGGVTAQEVLRVLASVFFLPGQQVDVHIDDTLVPLQMQRGIVEQLAHRDLFLVM